MPRSLTKLVKAFNEMDTDLSAHVTEEEFLAQYNDTADALTMVYNHIHPCEVVFMTEDHQESLSW